MTVKEAIYHLEDMREDTGLAYSEDERQSIALALIVLKTRTPQEEALIDAIMALEQG